ncbi:hypothetical protein JTE90_012346 [Oedothorax gibbosus]|uniref:Uncharacterized protein n=1 Tax=Oedothorax gibbosus TaxID=931172 RepID=A0AAV6V503_9ARAC|nr:hypothetical protein JTE90_012346 [Oedothorax gibbosus]
MLPTRIQKSRKTWLDYLSASSRALNKERDVIKGQAYQKGANDKQAGRNLRGHAERLRYMISIELGLV